MKSKKTKTIHAIIWTAVAVIFSFVARFVDVGIAGETQTEVGLVHLNRKFAEMYSSFDQTVYNWSENLGFFFLALVGVCGFFGLVQLIKRKNLLKVDAEILCMGVLYLITLGLYFLFTKVAITYRPIIVPGEDGIEPSFPSSHSMMAVVVAGAISSVIDRYLSNENLCKLIKYLLMILALFTFIFRLQSGAHWFTDIWAGLFMGGALISWYEVALAKFCTSSSEIPSSKSSGKHFKKQ